MDTTFADQDSDSLYVTNQPEIVKHAEYCYINYPTIVNNIPKEKNIYTNTPENFAIIDNNLSASQTDIGESSNLAQVCLSYTYNFNDTKINDYVCILSVLAQCAIDAAKRKFDVDVTAEIKRIKTEVNVKKNKYPLFWLAIRPGFNMNNINKTLLCPMNSIYNISLPKFRDNTKTFPISKFFIPHEKDISKRVAKKVQTLIEKYSLELLKYNSAPNEKQEDDQYLLLRHDFEKLIEDIRMTTLPDKYVYLMSWLIDRAFQCTPGMKSKQNVIQTKLDKNRTLLMKTLFEVNKNAFLSCFCVPTSDN